MTADTAIKRHRLFELLATRERLHVLTAPSGFGKTTLLRSWIDTFGPDGPDVIWVALSAHVTARRHLWQLVAASIVRRGALDDRASLELKRRVIIDVDPISAIVEWLSTRQRTLLVVDAYEQLRSVTGRIDQDLLRLVESVESLNVVVTTRASTLLSDEVTIMRGLVRVIDDADLRFTAEEAEKLVLRHAPQAAGSGSRVARETMGYPVAVRAMTYALGRNQLTLNSDDETWQRLVGADLKQQLADPTLIDFVLDTCVPPYFDHALAGRLSGLDDASVDRALADLKWNGFGRWIPYARERPVFQYVESVRETFQRQIRSTQATRYRERAGIAAEWLYECEDHDLALGLAVDAHRFRLAERICRRLIVSRGDVRTSEQFVRHLRRVPHDILPRFPVLAFITGMVYAGNPATRAAAPALLEHAAAHALDRLDELSPREQFYQHVGREVSLRYLGRGDEAGRAALAALAHLEAMSVDERDALGEFEAMALGILSYSLFEAGEVKRAGAAAEQAVVSARSEWWRNYALAYLVGIHALNGRGNDARSALALADVDSWSASQPRRIPVSLGATGQAALHLDRFELKAALRAYNDAAPEVAVAETWTSIAWTMMHARLGLGQARAAALVAEQALCETPRPPGVGRNLGTAAVNNVLAILWLADGQPARALEVLRSTTVFGGQVAPAKLLHRLVTGDESGALRAFADHEAEPGHTVRSTAAILSIAAAAACRLGNTATSLSLLARATALYELHGVRAHLMYLPQHDITALRQLAADQGEVASVRYLSAQVPSPIADIETSAARLSWRETEVLRSWARHRTRAEVAAALFVSPNTVRSHLNSAYRKLGVTTKDAAVQRAIELDLLHPEAT